MHYVKMIAHFNEPLYFFYETNNDDLRLIAEVVEQGATFRARVLEELADPSSQGVTGNSIRLTFEGDTVIIEPLYGTNTEAYQAQISRMSLCKFIHAWNFVITYIPHYILIVRKDNSIVVKPLGEDGELTEVEFDEEQEV